MYPRFTIPLTCLMLLLAASFPVKAQDSIHRADVLPLLKAVHDTLVYHHPFTQDAEGKKVLRDALLTAKTRWQQDSSLLPQGDSIVVADFFPYAGDLSTAVGCGHTMLSPITSAAVTEGLKERERRIPLIKTTEGTYLLIDTLQQDSFSIPQGTEVVALDGQDIGTLIDKLAFFQGFNDAGNRGGQLRYAGLALSWHYLNRFGLRDTVALTVREDEKTKTYPISLFYTYPEVKQEKKYLSPGIFRLRQLKDSMGWRLTIRSFSDRYLSDHNVKRLLSETFAKINASGQKKLVIDLRNNGGGNLRYVSELFAYLTDEPFTRFNDFYSYSPDARPSNVWNAIGLFIVGGFRRKDGRSHRPGVLKSIKPKPPGKRYDGDVVLLINEMTFSAATLLGHWFKAYECGQIVGRMSGGSSTVTYGGSMHTYLVGNQFSLQVPNYRIELARPVPGNLTPHHEVSFTQQDIIAERDAQLEKAIELLKGEGAANDVDR